MPRTIRPRIPTAETGVRRIGNVIIVVYSDEANAALVETAIRKAYFATPSEQVAEQNRAAATVEQK